MPNELWYILGGLLAILGVYGWSKVAFRSGVKAGLKLAGDLVPEFKKRHKQLGKALDAALKASQAKPKDEEVKPDDETKKLDR